MNSLLARFVGSLVIGGVLWGAQASWAADPAPKKAPQTDEQKQAEDDRAWLTAYMLAHQGYRLHHTDALEYNFNKMSPKQLRYLVDFYKESHQQRMQQANLELTQRKSMVAQTNAERKDQFNTAASSIEQGAEAGAANMQNQVNQMHQEAFSNYQRGSWQNTLYRNPGGFYWGGGSAYW